MTKAEFGSLCRQYTDAHAAEAAAKKVKETAKEALLKVEDKLFSKDDSDGLFFFDKDAREGVRKVVPVAKDVLDKKRALKYSQDKKFNDCVKTTESLNEDAFLARAKGGDVPAATFKNMVKKSKPSAPYMRILTNDPMQEEGPNG